MLWLTDMVLAYRLVDEDTTAFNRIIDAYALPENG